MSLAGVQIARLRELIDQEKRRNSGELPLNVSPYGILVQALAWGETDKLRTGLAKTAQKERLVITNEMDLPDWVREPETVNVVRV